MQSLLRRLPETAAKKPALLRHLLLRLPVVLRKLREGRGLAAHTAASVQRRGAAAHRG